MIQESDMSEEVNEIEIDPVRKRVLVIGATYMEDKKGIFIVGECDEGSFEHLIDRDSLATFGDRSEEEIVEEMHKTADLMEGKQIWLIFDPSAQKKLDNGEDLDYSGVPESVIESSEEKEEKESDNDPPSIRIQ
jgi:hypothetical protein